MPGRLARTSRTTQFADFKHIFAKEERRKQQRDKLASSNGILPHSPSLYSPNEQINFAPCSRPSRTMFLQDLLIPFKQSLLEGDIFFFLVRPIKSNDEYFQGVKPDQITQEHVVFAFQERGIENGRILQLEQGSVTEFAVLIFCEDIHKVPREDYPLLVVEPRLARKAFRTPILPLLVEILNQFNILPSHLIYIPPPRFMPPFLNDQSRCETIQWMLHRNRHHKNRDCRVIKHILDHRFNLLPLLKDEQSRQRLNFQLLQSITDSIIQQQEQQSLQSLVDSLLNFTKAQHLKSRSPSDDWNIQEDLTPFWCNVIVDWDKVHQRKSKKSQSGLPLELLVVSDDTIVTETGKEERGSNEQTFLIYTCPQACFAESTICNTSTGHCRFLNWKDPCHDWNARL